MKVMLVTGVPGTGKTTLAKKLAKKLGYFYLDVNKVISKHKLSEGYDRNRKTKIVGVDKLNKKLIGVIEKSKINGIIIDSHLSHYLPKKYADICIVTKCDIKELNKRLRKKKFHKNKIMENVQAEIFDVCYNEAKERKHNVVVVDTTKSFNIKKLTKKIGVKC